MDEDKERMYLQRIAEDAAGRAREVVDLQMQVKVLRGKLQEAASERDDLAGRLETIEAQMAPAQGEPPAAV